MKTPCAGFTLIELLVVTGLSVMLIIAASSLFFTSLVTNSRKATLTLVKQEGDYALSQMEFLLRNSVALVPNTANPQSLPCTPGMNSISFRGQDNNITTLSITDNKIASVSATTTNYFTSAAVTLNNSPLFDCQQVSNSGGYVVIHFTLGAENTDFSAPNNTSDTFTTSVNIRSY